jgi:uncharacterized protein
MKCPVCNLEMNMAERQGLEIDYCQQCRGIWLDRGELDKIIERSYAPSPSPDQRMERSPSADYRQNDHGHGDDHYRYGKYKKKNFIRDVFDF